MQIIEIRNESDRRAFFRAMTGRKEITDWKAAVADAIEAFFCLREKPFSINELFKALRHFPYADCVEHAEQALVELGYTKKNLAPEGVYYKKWMWVR